MDVTIKSIAKATGYSPATVGQVLRGYEKSRVSDKVKSLILDYAKQAGYTPNLIARALRTGKSNAVSLITTSDVGELYVLRHREIERLLRVAGFRCFSWGVTNTTFQNNKQLASELIHLSSDAVILAVDITQSIIDDVIKPIREVNIPLVVLDPIKIKYVDNIIIDRIHGGYLATKHLLEMGHTKIGFISSKINHLIPMHKFIGYQKALAEHEIPFDSGLCESAPALNECKDAYMIAKSLLKRRPDLTAIFCQSDIAAFGAIKAITEFGFKVPEDISIVGFDNVSFSAFAPVPLTTVEQPIMLQAKSAVDLIFARLGTQNPYSKPKHIELKPRLIIRESVAKYNR